MLFQFNSVRADDLQMDCRITDLDVPSMLKFAPSGAKRVSPYILQVNWQKGKSLFEDPLPYDEENGHTWAYCGYSAKAKMHLIKQNNGNFTGKLLNERTGKILPAGQDVLISPNLKYYLASSQPDGLDGQEWVIYGVDGIIVWEGYSFIENPIRKDSILAELSEPFWNSKGNLESSYTCLSALPDNVGSTTVTLEEVKGVYNWVPEAKCAVINE